MRSKVGLLAVIALALDTFAEQIIGVACIALMIIFGGAGIIYSLMLIGCYFILHAIGWKCRKALRRLLQLDAAGEPPRSASSGNQEKRQD